MKKIVGVNLWRWLEIMVVNLMIIQILLRQGYELTEKDFFNELRN